MQNRRTKSRFELSVWDNINGDVVKKLWDASEEEYDALVEQYEDEPGHEVVIDREWDADETEED